MTTVKSKVLIDYYYMYCIIDLMLNDLFVIRMKIFSKEMQKSMNLTCTLNNCIRKIFLFIPINMK